MAEGTIIIGSITLDTPKGYTHEPIKLESYERTIKGNMIINRSVTSEDQPIDLYRFEITDIVNSKLRELEAEFRHIGNLDYVDHIQIEEVLSGDGSTTIFYTQRRMSGDTPVPIVTLDGVSKNVIVTDDTNPEPGNVYAKADVDGRARFIFGDTPTDANNNIIILYEPKYYVHMISYRRSGVIKDVAYYTLICEETKQ